MKNSLKILLIVFFVSFITVGCEFGKKLVNTPIKQVEIFLNKYQTLDQDVLDDLDYVIAEDEHFNAEQRDLYRNIMKKHYQNLTYNIKNEKIDGDTATVTVEIEVVDHSKTMREAKLYLEQNPKEFENEEGVYDDFKFTDYRLEQLKKDDERVTYTLDLTLTKNNDMWVMNDLSSADEDKIHGMYDK